MFTDRDYEEDYQEEDCVSVTLRGTTPSSSSDSVEISEDTITITEEGAYLISGTLSDGMIIVDAPDTAKVRLIFEGVEINSETSAPLYILEADKVFLTLAGGSENTLSNSGTYTAIDDSNIESVIYSKQDLTLNGTGTLTISSPGGHGIVSNDDLAITDGTYNITAASHGLKANDSIRITGGSQLTVTAGKDGIHAENDEDPSLGFVYISDGTIAVEAEGDGISAGSYMQIAAGTFQIQAGGGSENGTKESSDSWGEFRGGGAPGGRQSCRKGPGRRRPGSWQDRRPQRERGGRFFRDRFSGQAFCFRRKSFRRKPIHRKFNYRKFNCRKFRSGRRFFRRRFQVNRGREQHQHERSQSRRRSADFGRKLYH